MARGRSSPRDLRIGALDPYLKKPPNGQRTPGGGGSLTSGRSSPLTWPGLERRFLAVKLVAKQLIQPLNRLLGQTIVFNHRSLKRSSCGLQQFFGQRRVRRL